MSAEKTAYLSTILPFMIMSEYMYECVSVEAKHGQHGIERVTASSPYFRLSSALSMSTVFSRNDKRAWFSSYFCSMNSICARSLRRHRLALSRFCLRRISLCCSSGASRRDRGRPSSNLGIPDLCTREEDPPAGTYMEEVRWTEGRAPVYVEVVRLRALDARGSLFFWLPDPPIFSHGCY